MVSCGFTGWLAYRIIDSTKAFVTIYQKAIDRLYKKVSAERDMTESDYRTFETKDRILYVAIEIANNLSARLCVLADRIYFRIYSSLRK